MFNGATNRLLESTNSELGRMRTQINEYFVQIESKLPGKNTEKPHRSILALNIIVAVALLSLVIMQSIQQSHIKTLNSVMRKNNETIEQLQKTMVNNVNAFNELQLLQAGTAQKNQLLIQAIDQLGNQNKTLQWKIRKIESQNTDMHRLLTSSLNNSNSYKE